MKINCPHCSKEIEFLVKSNVIAANVNVQSIQPHSQSSVTTASQTPIISRGAPIQSHGTVYYRDNNTGQVFVQQTASNTSVQVPQPTIQSTQSQLNLSNGVSKTVQESVKTNVANNPNNIDPEKLRSAAFGTPKPGNVVHEQKHKEAENILSRLASSDGIKR